MNWKRSLIINKRENKFNGDFGSLIFGIIRAIYVMVSFKLKIAILGACLCSFYSALSQDKAVGSISINIYQVSARWSDVRIKAEIEKAKHVIKKFCGVDINISAWKNIEDAPTQSINRYDHPQMIEIAKDEKIDVKNQIHIFFMDLYAEGRTTQECVEGLSFNDEFLNDYGEGRETLAETVWMMRGDPSLCTNKSYGENHSVLLHEMMHIILNTYSVKRKKAYLSHSPKESLVTKEQCEAIMGSEYFMSQ